MAFQQQHLSESAKQYLTRITNGIPGGVACTHCFAKNTYVLLATQWRQIDETKYSFKQLVKCDKCEGKTQYEWEHDFSLGAAPVRK